jgi:hypothetical protein
MDIDEQRLRDKVVLLDEELPREAGRCLLDRLLALRVLARSVADDALENLDDEPLANAVPDLKRAAFDHLDGVMVAIDAAYDAAETLSMAIRAQRPDLVDPLDPDGPSGRS